MTLTEATDAISNTDWAQQIAGSWLFPFFETIHVFSLVAVLGAIAIVDWRLIGFASMGFTLKYPAAVWMQYAAVSGTIVSNTVNIPT